MTLTNLQPLWLVVTPRGGSELEREHTAYFLFIALDQLAQAGIRAVVSDDPTHAGACDGIIVIDGPWGPDDDPAAAVMAVRRQHRPVIWIMPRLRSCDVASDLNEFVSVRSWLSSHDGDVSMRLPTLPDTAVVGTVVESGNRFGIWPRRAAPRSLGR